MEGCPFTGTCVVGTRVGLLVGMPAARDIIPVTRYICTDNILIQVYWQRSSKDQNVITQRYWHDSRVVAKLLTRYTSTCTDITLLVKILQMIPDARFL